MIPNGFGRIARPRFGVRDQDAQSSKSAIMSILIREFRGTELAKQSSDKITLDGRMIQNFDLA
jgi:hypothetical protein